MISLPVRLMAVLALLFSASTLGQDISGNYRLDVQQDPGASDCVWSGALQMTQTGGNPGTFNGTGSANVVSGPCLDFSGTFTGSINGNVLDFGIGAGALGTVDFNGVVGASGQLSGSWTGLGLTGTWTATPLGTTPVPALPPLLLAILGGLIGLVGLRRLRAGSTSDRTRPPR